ncbi:MAG: hypothetical protein AAF719_12615, partial [Pseudomonadota bacterium]
NKARSALVDGRLDETDAFLAEGRRALLSKGEGPSVDLAELTAVAGDHAAAAGRPGGAKWLWRLALQRFAEVGAIDSDVAQSVSERLRMTDEK